MIGYRSGNCYLSAHSVAVVGMNLSVNVRTVAPSDANSKAGCWIARPTIIGAMTKAAALSPTARSKADLSRHLISLKNRLPIFMFWTHRISKNENEDDDVSFLFLMCGGIMCFCSYSSCPVVLLVSSP